MISIIVTVYNTEQYLEKCIESLCNQTEKEIEIIIVDDGSTDSSPCLIDKYAECDSRIIAVHKSNGGETSARKAGIKIAQGDYILFVDSDDWIDVQAVEKIYKKAIQDNADVVIADWQIHDGEIVYDDIGNMEEGLYKEEKKKYFAKNMIYKGNVQTQGINASMNTKMYKIDLLKRMFHKLPDGIVYAEDDFFVYAILAVAQRITVYHYPFYHYLMRYDSISHSLDDWYLKDLNEGYRFYLNAIDGIDNYSIFKRQIEVYMQRAIYHGMGKYLGFEEKTNLGWYTCDISNLKKHSRIIIYGAGKVGRCYYRRFIHDNRIEIVGWTDKQYKVYSMTNKEIDSLDIISSEEFDYILIAVDNEKLADKIREDLNDTYKVNLSKIIWKKPENEIDSRLSNLLE